MSTAHPRYTLAQDIPAGTTRSITSIKFSSKGLLLAASSADGSVRLHPVVSSSDAPLSPQPSVLGEQHEAGVNEVSFSSDDRLLCTASDDKTLVLWDVEACAPLRTLRGHSHHVFCCAFSPTSSLLLSGSYDESVKLWDVRQAKPARTLAAHSEPITSVDCSAAHTQAVSASYDGLARVWDLTTGACLRTIYVEKTPPVSAVRFTPNGKFVLSSYLDGRVRLWDYQASGLCVKEYSGHVNARFCCASGFLVTHARKYLVSGSEDGHVVVWDIQSRDVVQRIEVGGPAAGAKPSKAALGVGVALAVSCHPTRHILVSSVTVEAGERSHLKVFVDNDTETVVEPEAASGAKRMADD